MTTLAFSPKLDAKKQAVVVPLFPEDIEKLPDATLKGLSAAQKKAVKLALSSDHLPKSGIAPIYSTDALVLLQILGKKKATKDREAREAGELVYSVAKKYHLETIAVAIGSLSDSQVTAYREGVALGTYEFTAYRGKVYAEKTRHDLKVKKISFLAPQNKEELKQLNVLREATAITKDLINTPPVDATPTFMEKQARKVAKLRGVRLKVLKEKELKALGAGGILAVGKASDEESRLLILHYSAGGRDKPVALVGKGVTFDTGGLSLKTGQYMMDMKMDLGGAATVLGAFYAIAASGLKKNVVCVIPTVENVVSAKAYKPDDVLKMYSGTTVEVTNTDAEGRLILADALAYTCDKLKPAAIVDAATLTGACFVALGTDYTAAMATDKKLLSALQKASDATDEPIWELPLPERYGKLMKSSVADMVNHTSKLKAGTIQGGLFLKHFVEKGVPFCHLDIASVAFDEGKKLATGRNVRLLWKFIASR